MADALTFPEHPDDLTPVVAQPVKPEDQPDPSQEDTMSKRTVAMNYSDLQNQSVRLDNLEAALSEALETVESQAQMIANLELDVARAHGRLDKARKVIQGLASTPTPQTTQTSRPQTTKKRGFSCGIENCSTNHTSEWAAKQHEEWVASRA